MADNSIRGRRLNPSLQAAGIRQAWPSLTVTVKNDKLIALGKITPNAITNEYSIRLEYHKKTSIQIFVEDPPLKRRPQEPDLPIPHTYNAHLPGQERPCVYYPRTDWNETKPIAKTVIPWLMCWLIDYELWYATGKWLGGGIEHLTPKREEELP